LTKDRRFSGASGSDDGVDEGDGGSPPVGAGEGSGAGDGLGDGDGLGAGAGAGGAGGAGGEGGGGVGGGVATNAACDTAIVCPPMLTLPVRAPPLLAATVIVALPGPLPLADANVIQLLVVCATHQQPEPSVTVIVVEPPVEVNDDCAADAPSHRTRARQMFAVAAPLGRSDQKYNVCESPLTAG